MDEKKQIKFNKPLYQELEKTHSNPTALLEQLARQYLSNMTTTDPFRWIKKGG
jgi:hypothetical protein